MKLRTRLAATALAAGSLLGTAGAFVGTAHAADPGPVTKLPGGTVKIDPCVLNPSLCTPNVPKVPGGGKVPIDPCVLIPDLCKPPKPPTKDPGNPGTTTPPTTKPPTTTPDPGKPTEVVVVNVDAPVRGNPTFTG